MTPRLVIAAGILAASASVASAQAPGQIVVFVPSTPAVAAPVMMVEAPRPQVEPLRHRFSLGVSLGSLHLGGEDGTEPTSFNLAEFALRYRASRRIEIEMTSFGGRQMYDDGEEGDLATGSLAFGMRYRFLPERRLNWFASVGVGGTIIASHTATDEEIQQNTYPLMTLGIGGEWRFRPRWALQAEMKFVSVGANADTDAPPTIQPEGDAVSREAGEPVGGGTFTFGLSVFL